MNIVLAHGWGYDARLWDGVREHLSPALCVATIDFGYFAHPRTVPPAPTFSGPVLAVGHSLGSLWWLAQTTIDWKSLLCINGFPRFTATADYPGVAPRVLDRMRKQFAIDPAAVLADFHARCGAPGPAERADAAALAAGLAQLAAIDGRPALAARGQDIRALAGTADPIVPRTMSEAAFAALPAGHLVWIEAPGHLLPLTHPALCAQWIERLAT